MCLKVIGIKSTEITKMETDSQLLMRRSQFSSPTFTSSRSPPPIPRGTSCSPSPPQTSIALPTPMSIESMASMLGHAPPNFLPPGYPRDFSLGRLNSDDFAASMHKFMDRSFGGSLLMSGGDCGSPPPPVAPNDPAANECKIIEYRGEKIASFVIAGRNMMCLPQAFDLFLKHLVGGLHTVYTKLKRLEITPIVCNVEQVRVLRGLGAIQPGVNRCKLLADADFDLLFKDCTTSSSRPGRPPKRGMPFPAMSPQDAMLHLKNTIQQVHNGGGLIGPGLVGQPLPPLDIYKDNHYNHKEPRLDKHHPFANGFPPHGTPPPGINPMTAQFMAMNNPAAAAAQAAFLSQTAAAAAGLPPPNFSAGLPPISSSPNIMTNPPEPPQFLKATPLSSLEALQRSGILGAAYIERMREGQKYQDFVEEQKLYNQDIFGKEHRTETPIINLSKAPSDDVLGSDDGNDEQNSVQRNFSNFAASEDDDDSEDNHDSEDVEEDLSMVSTEKRLKHTNVSIVDDEDTAKVGGGLNNNNSGLIGSSGIVLDSPISSRRDSGSNTTTPSLLPSVPVQQLHPGLPFNPAFLMNPFNAINQFDGLNHGYGGNKQDFGGTNEHHQLNSVYGLIGNIQNLLKAAVENAKVDDSQKSELKAEIQKDKDTEGALHRELEELRRNTAINLRRFKKEKKFRRRLQDQLEQETKRRLKMEEALRLASAETLMRITESLQQERRRSAAPTNTNATTNISTSCITSTNEVEGVATGQLTNVSVATAAVIAAQYAVASSESSSADDSSPISIKEPSASASLGFAKNLFPFNGASLFTGANSVV